MTEASATSAARPSTVILECPKCGELGEADAGALELTCPECGHEWTKKPARTADETIAIIRNLLAEQQDASRRSFYETHSTLYAVATAIDAYPDPPVAAPVPLYALQLSRGIFPQWHIRRDCGGHGITNVSVWNGTLAEAIEIARKEYPPDLGIGVNLVLVNAKELVK